MGSNVGLGWTRGLGLVVSRADGHSGLGSVTDQSQALSSRRKFRLDVPSKRG